MPDVNEFELIVNSLGENLFSYLGGRDRLRALTISADELTGTAEIAIVMTDQSWTEQQRAIDVMIDMREMFLDEISFDYRFDSAAELSHTASAKAPQVQFA